MQALLLLRACTYLTFYENLKTRVSLCNNVWSTIKTFGKYVNNNKYVIFIVSKYKTYCFIFLDSQVDINCYNALLQAYLENQIDFSPIDILAELKEKNLQPNYLTYQRFIEHYCKNGDIISTTKMLEIMNKENVPINEIIFNSLIEGHAMSGYIAFIFIFCNQNL
jgi:hypothetical protein